MKKMLLIKWSIPPLGGIALLIILVLSINVQAFSQELKQVKGTVLDPDKLPLSGVTVLIKGTKRMTATNAEGKYTIQAKNTEVIVFSLVGMESQEVGVGNQANISITLNQSVNELKEVKISVGYGTTRKSDLTGSIGQLNMKDVSKAPVASFAEALAGRLAGVQVSSSDGQPGAVVNIQVRGPGSLTQSTAPLYVVDGFPIEDLDPTTINPEEIASLTVLKDASSTAIYGSRGANGVILITTKRGRIGAPVVNFSAQVGITARPKEIPLMSPYEFVKYQQEIAPTLSSTQAYFTGGKTLDSYKDVPGTYIQNYLFHSAGSQIYNLALRGGNDLTQYSVSGSFYNQGGGIINTGLSRYNGRVSIDQKISSKVKAGITVNYSNVVQSGQQVDQSLYAGASNPTAYLLATAALYRPILSDPSGNILTDLYDQQALTASDIRINPFIAQENLYLRKVTNVVDANAYISYDITKSLTFKSYAGIHHNLIRSDAFYNTKTPQGSPFTPNNQNGVNGSTLNNLTSDFNNSNTLTYKTVINNDHTITGLALFELGSVNTGANGYSGKLLPNENLGINGLEQGTPYNAVYASSKNTVASYATRWDYNYKSKYSASFSFRADGSSKFITNKWGYFPSAGLAWNMQNEDFFKKLFPIVSNSKLRINYGTSGNNRIGDFAAVPSLVFDPNTNGYSFNNATPTGGAYVNNVGNVDLKWETIKTWDMGYEFGILRDRITLEVDAYRRTTTDLLLNATLPPTTGFTTAVKNIGALRNDGIEFTLNTVNIDTKSFKWQSSFNISFNKNIILALTRGQTSLPSTVSYVSQFNQPLYLAEIGKPAGMMIGYVWQGNYQYSDFNQPSPGVYVLKPNVPNNGSATRATVQPGDIKYKDLNGDGTITSADVTYIGRGQPIHTGGFSNNFSYKGFDLNVFFQWSYGNNIYNANRQLLEGNSNKYVLVNQFASYENRWEPNNPTNENYRAGGQGPIGFFSSKNVEDGSYLRLKTVSLSYTIPARMTQKWGISNLSVNVSAQNLATITNYTGLDPEVSTRNNVLTPGYDFSSYPKSPVIVFGVKATL